MESDKTTMEFKDLLISILKSYYQRYSKWPSKTRLLKLAYLIDLFYKRRFGTRLLSNTWIYYLYGPYITDYDSVKEAVKCTKYILDTGEEFNCTFNLPVLVGHTTTCKGSNMWLECVNWTKGSTETKELDGLDGKTKVEITNWCCNQWNITAYGGTYNGTTREIINVSSCGDYDWDVWPAVGASETEVITKLETVIEEDPTGTNIWGISDPTTYYNSIKDKIVKAIKEGSEIELLKGEDPNNSNITRLFMYNLEPHTTIPCLKVKYVKDSTKGFCHTSPAGTEVIKEAGWAGLSIIVDIGATSVAALSGVGTAWSGFIGCEAGNIITYFGQDQISKDKEKKLWPNNKYYGKYFSKN